MPGTVGGLTSFSLIELTSAPWMYSEGKESTPEAPSAHLLGTSGAGPSPISATAPCPWARLTFPSLMGECLLEPPSCVFFLWFSCLGLLNDFGLTTSLLQQLSSETFIGNCVPDTLKDSRDGKVRRM